MLNFKKIKKSTLFIIFILSLLNTSFTQNTNNPFELTPRLKELPIPTSPSTQTENDNPFDILPPTFPAKGSPPTIETTPLTPEKAKETVTNISTPIDDGFGQFLFLTLLTMMILLTLSITLFRDFIEKAYRAFFNENVLNQMYRMNNNTVPLSFLVLYGIFFLHAGIFILLISKKFNVTITDSHFYSLLFCIVGVSVFFIIKHSILKIISYVFPIEKEIGSYSFTIIIFSIIVSLVLVPFIILIAYGPENWSAWVIYLALITVGIIYIYRSLRGLIIANKFLAFYSFHFLLYICAVEIAPLLILVKSILS